MLRKILLCGDSFGTIDALHPGLHFSEKIQQKLPDVEVLNFSAGGHSNNLIYLQLLQGLKFNPDGIIILLTSAGRREFDIKHSQFWENKLKNAQPGDAEWHKVSNSNKHKYITTAHLTHSDSHDLLKLSTRLTCYEPYEWDVLKNYLTVVAILNKLTLTKIPFCFSLGGLLFDANNYQSAYQELTQKSNGILSQYSLTNELTAYYQFQIDLNLWDHANYDSGPGFHVGDNDIQTAFANECMHKLGLT